MHHQSSTGRRHFFLAALSENTVHEDNKIEAIHPGQFEATHIGVYCGVSSSLIWERKGCSPGGAYTILGVYFFSQGA